MENSYIKDLYSECEKNSCKSKENRKEKRNEERKEERTIWRQKWNNFQRSRLNALKTYLGPDFRGILPILTGAFD